MNYLRIEVKNKYLSKAIQEMSFEYGFHWNLGKPDVRHTDKKYLYFYDGKEIAYSDSEDSFKKAEDTLYTYDSTDFGAIEAWFKSISEEEKIRIGDYTVEFQNNGVIKVGCTSVSFDILEKVYNKAKFEIEKKNFKAGDIVKCISTQQLPCESENWTYCDNIGKGDKLVVTSYNPNYCGGGALGFKGCTYSHPVSKFIKI